MVVKNQTSRGGAWWLLLLVPAVLTLLILFPGLGEHGEGLLPEVIAAHVADTEAFQGFASDTRRWGGAIFGLSCILGILVWLALRSGWRKRLLSFDADQVHGYRGYVFARLLYALLLMIPVVAGLILLSSALRGLPFVSWIMVAGAASVVAALQYFMTVWGISETRRLFRGR